MFRVQTIIINSKYSIQSEDAKKIYLQYTQVLLIQTASLLRSPVNKKLLTIFKTQVYIGKFKILFFIFLPYKHSRNFLPALRGKLLC